MAKLLSQPKLDRGTHKRVFGFSDWEIDVANQLLHFGRNYKPILGTDEPNKHNNANEDLKPKKNPDGETDFSFKEDLFEDDQDSYPIPKRLNQRFRSIQHIYMSTQPMLDGVVKAKKARLT